MICGFAVQLLKGIFVPLERNTALNRILEIACETEAVMHIGVKPVPKLSDSEIATERFMPHMHIGSVTDFMLGKERMASIVHPLMT